MSSIFTKIYNWEIKSDFLYKDSEVFAIKDINPKAKTHILIIPVKEIKTINDLELSDKDILSKLFFVAKQLASDLWISDWYKLHFNVWEKGWQEVMHIHLHLLSDI